MTISPAPPSPTAPPPDGPPLTIALLSFEYPAETGFGGIGTYTWHHARALAALGHRVHVLAGAKAPTALRTEVHDGVQVHRFWAEGRVMQAFERLGGFKLWWTRQRLQNAWSMYHGIKALHRTHRFDVLEMPECGAEGALVTRLLGVPTVVKLHSPSRLIMGAYDVRPLDVTLCSAIEQRGINGATAVTSCSQFLADEVAGKLGVRRPIPVVTNGLDIPWFDATIEQVDVHAKYELPRRPLTIVFTGRMERRKGIHLMPEIARAILERHDVNIVLAGADLFGYVANTLQSVARRAHAQGLPPLARRPAAGRLAAGGERGRHLPAAEHLGELSVLMPRGHGRRQGHRLHEPGRDAGAHHARRQRPARHPRRCRFVRGRNRAAHRRPGAARSTRARRARQGRGRPRPHARGAAGGRALSPAGRP